MSKVRIGIIGIGGMGTSHAQNIFNGKVTNGRLAAVCDIKQDRLDWAKEAFGDDVKRFDDAETMIKSGEIDAIVIAVPHYFHPEFAIMGFNNGLHVLCEKPAGVYTKQVKEMNEVAKKTDRKFSMMFNQRTNPLYKKVKDLVESGELGELKRVNWIITNWFRTQYYYDSGDWRATWSGEGGGVLVNQCPHQLDLIQWICGMPNKITAFAGYGKYHNIEVEDEVTAYLEYPNGATGVFITSTGEAPGTNRLEIAGDRGKIVVEGDGIEFYRLRTSTEKFLKEEQQSFASPECWKCEVPVRGIETAHVGVLNNWCDAIATGSDLLASGTEGINGVELANAMHLSSWLGKTVELPVDEDLYLTELNKRIDSSTFVKKEVKGTVADLSDSFKGI